MHDVTSPQAFKTLADRDIEVFSPELTFGSPEHSVTILAGRTEASNPLSQQFVPLMRQNFAGRGMTLFDIDSPDHGIVHVIGPELGLTLPGTTVVCGDSHTCTNGGLGALGFGVGTSEVAHVLATQSLVQRRPAMMRIMFAGALAPHVSPKDLILHTIARLGADAGTGCAIEFAGPLIEPARRRRAHDDLQSRRRDRRQDRTRRAGRRHVRVRRLPPLRPARLRVRCGRRSTGAA